MRLTRTVIVGAWLSALAACEAFGGDSPGEAEPTSKDAGTKTPKDAGGTDSRPSDPDTIAEAGVDPVDSGGPNRVYGAIPYDKEDHFERTTLEGSGGPFNWQVVSGSGAIFAPAQCDDPKCSPSNIATFKNKPDYNYVHFETSLKPETRVVRLDFAMKLTIDETRPDANEPQVQIASFDLEDNRFIIIEMFDGDFRLVDQYKNAGDENFNNKFSPLGTAVVNAWATYRVFLNLDTARLVLAVNGELFGVPVALRPEVVKKLEKARIGISYADPKHVFKLRFDDVGMTEWTE